MRCVISRNEKSPCETGFQYHPPPRGVEQGSNSSGNTGFAPQRDANSDALSGNSAPIDPGLALIVNIWPALPESVRKNVLTIIRTAAQHHASGGDA
jgi:hypothetical protein